MPKIYKGDIGTVFTVTVYSGNAVKPISTATTKTIKFKKPSGLVVSKAGSFVTDGSDGQYQYTTVEGDLDEAGDWEIQGYVVLSDWSGHTETDTFPVHEYLS